MKKIIKERINSLRLTLKAAGLNALIIPSTDPHLSEYIAPHWKAREFISGFNGSAGTVVITLEEAGLWTDSRYFLQAAEQLKDTGIKLFKEALPETPSIPDYLGQQLPIGGKVGIDGALFSISQVNQLKESLADFSLETIVINDPISSIWENRPQKPQSKAYSYDDVYAGERCQDKIESMKSTLEGKKAEAILISALDEIAWTLNIRGNDIHCSPVIVSYLLITTSHTIWFVSPDKITNELKGYLKRENIEVIDYEKTLTYLKSLSFSRIILDPQKTNYAIYSAIGIDKNILFESSPIALLKAQRNDTEIQNLHIAMQKDGIALTRFLIWLEKAIHNGSESELSISDQLQKFRSKQELYKGDSFDTIAGYGEHAAIVHYSATQETNSTLMPKGFLLLDSGGQYLNGTTDITRTIALGPLTQEEKEDYTSVLKGHIALASAKFPYGTRGTQLDILAHLPLWKKGLNYLHGTGHGVGHFLNVHEGPQSIRMNENPVILKPGMVISNEPGVYKAGSHGIRIENLVLVTKDETTPFGDFLRFETLTLCPICKKGIVKAMLSSEEIEWINNYHQKVYSSLSPSLNKNEREWLKDATSTL